MCTGFRRLLLGVALGAILTDHWPSVAKVVIPVFLLAFLAFDLWSDWKEARAALPTEEAP
jgi:uncharacterized membrane protein YfcA